MVALNVDIWSQAGVWHWASTSSKGTHSTETDTLEVTSSCEEVVDGHLQLDEACAGRERRDAAAVLSSRATTRRRR